MALAGDWGKAERYARLGQLGGYQAKDGKPFVYRRGMPKLTPAQQEAVLMEYSLKQPLRAIAAKYGIAPSYVSKLASRKGMTMHQPASMRANKARAARNRKPKPPAIQARIMELRARLASTEEE